MSPASSSNRLEILVLITALATAVLTLTLNASQNRRSVRTQSCMDNLRELGQTSVIVAHMDSRMIPHRQSSAGIAGWRGLGGWDWGGADGACGEYRTGWPYSPERALGAATRPYNVARFGNVIPPNADFGVFHCPADVGYQPVNSYTPYYFDASPCDQSSADAIFLQSAFTATGTSYQGEVLWIGNSTADHFGSFMRPYELFPNAAETVMFADGRFVQAYFSTEETLSVLPFTGPPTTITPWHGSEGFNQLLVDGHAQSVQVAVSGSMLDALTFDPLVYDRQYVLRGANWRIDALPEVYISERGAGGSGGNPLPPNFAGPASSIQSRQRITN